MDQLALKSIRKLNGVHYTPKPFADFLARQIWQCCQFKSKPRLKILDPACGEGQLLASMVDVIGADVEIEIVGYEIDQQAAEQARQSLTAHVDSCEIVDGDFLESVLDNSVAEFDLIITKPAVRSRSKLEG